MHISIISQASYALMRNSTRLVFARGLRTQVFVADIQLIDNDESCHCTIYLHSILMLIYSDKEEDSTLLYTLLYFPYTCPISDLPITNPFSLTNSGENSAIAGNA
jgi:hypothetical protein